MNALRNRMHFAVSRHHSMGNAFLVCLLSDQSEAQNALKHFEKIRQKNGWGQGINGLILAWDIESNKVRQGTANFAPGNYRVIGTDAVQMLLLNADGGRAEISGNGLCCLAQAVARITGRSSLVLHVHTDAGQRKVTIENGLSELSNATTTMGTPVVGRPDVNQLAQAAVQEFSDRAIFIDVGNPHLVAEVKNLEEIDIIEVGSLAKERFGDVNVECFHVDEDGTSVKMKVWERGVGVTEACGSGAIAVVAACENWGLLTVANVPVSMPGGVATVTLGEPMLFTTYVHYMQ